MINTRKKGSQTGYTTEIKHGPERKGDIPHSLASIQKAETILGYQPTHTLDKGLKEVVDWYWENLKYLWVTIFSNANNIYWMFSVDNLVCLSLLKKRKLFFS